jgi:hypothetical protein
VDVRSAALAAASGTKQPQVKPHSVLVQRGTAKSGALIRNGQSGELIQNPPVQNERRQTQLMIGRADFTASV